MTKLKFLFRFFLLVSLACWLAGVALDNQPEMISVKWSEAISHRGEGALPWQELLVGRLHFEPTPELKLVALGALYALSGMGYIGMFIFSRLGRGLYLLVLMIHFCLIVISGLTVFSPLEQALLNLGLTLDGALLGMAYTSPLAALFAYKKPAIEHQTNIQPPITAEEDEPLSQPNEKVIHIESSDSKDVMPPLPQI